MPSRKRLKNGDTSKPGDSCTIKKSSTASVHGPTSGENPQSEKILSESNEGKPAKVAPTESSISRDARQKDGVNFGPEKNPAAAVPLTYSQACRGWGVSATATPVDLHIQLQRIVSGQDPRTTVMIRDIPSRYSQLSLLHDLCSSKFFSFVDYVYLPLDIRSLCPLGYAFVNFVHPRHIVDFFKQWNGRNWHGFNTTKTCSLSYARVQGRKNLLKQLVSSKNLLATNIACRPVIIVPEGLFYRTVSALKQSHRRIDQIACSLLLFQNIADPVEDRYIPIAFGDIPLLPFLKKEETEFLTATEKERELWSEHFVYESKMSQEFAETLRAKLDYISSELRRRPIRVKQQHVRSLSSPRSFHFSASGIYPIPYPQTHLEGNSHLLDDMEPMSPFTILTLPHIMDVQTFFKYILSAVLQGNTQLEQSWSSASTNGSTSPVHSTHTAHSTPFCDHSPDSTSCTKDTGRTPLSMTPPFPAPFVPTLVPLSLSGGSSAAHTVAATSPSSVASTCSQASCRRTEAAKFEVASISPLPSDASIADEQSLGDRSMDEQSTDGHSVSEQPVSDAEHSDTDQSEASTEQPSVTLTAVFSTSIDENSASENESLSKLPKASDVSLVTLTHVEKNSLRISANSPERPIQYRHPLLPQSPIDSPRSIDSGVGSSTPAASPVPSIPPFHPIRAAF